MEPGPAIGRPREAPARRLTEVDALAQLSFFVQGTLQRLAAEQDLSITQTRMLGVLRDRVPRMTELADILGLDKSSTTGLVDRAERRGLVGRVAVESDLRASRVKITGAGQSLVAEVAERFAGEMSATLENLPPRDRETLAGLLSTLVIAQAAERGIDLFADLGER